MARTGEIPSVVTKNPKVKPRVRIRSDKVKPAPAFMVNKRMSDNKVNMPRVIETLVIAAISSLAIYIGSLARLETKVENLEGDMTEIKNVLAKIQGDIYVFAGKQPVMQSPQGNYYFLPKDQIQDKPDPK